MELLATTTNGRRDKNDVLLQELVSAKNWKQALANCEKRLKKGEKSDGFLVNKAHILLAFPDAQHQKQGTEELGALLERKPPITDVKILLAIENAAELRHATDSRIATIWDRAVGGNPKNEDIYKVWIRRKFKKGDYKAAQKGAMMYQKNFPQKREPFFWAILSSHLAAEVPSATEGERNLYETLAYRFLSKAVSDAINGEKTQHETNSSSKPALRSIRAIQTSDDLQLLVAIYRSQGKYKETLAILDDPVIGLTSKIGGKSWDLVREKIELLEVCELWRDLWQFCEQLLLDARSDNLKDSERSPHMSFGAFGDDWKVWKGLITASAKVSNRKLVADLTEDLIGSFRDLSPRSRHPLLALVLFYSTIPPSANSHDEAQLFCCKRYFEVFAAKPACFDDLYPYVHLLDVSQCATFLSEISTLAKARGETGLNSESQRAAWIQAEINVLKFGYSLVVSRREVSEDPIIFEAFISNCLRLYKASSSSGSDLPATDQRPGDDAAILAAMACIHLFRKGQSAALLRCAIILERLLSHSKHNYAAQLMIIRVYIYLGAITQAAEHYGKLDIKHIQNHTTAWILLTRISTLHPHAVQVKPNSLGLSMFDPASALNKALQWMNKSEIVMKSGVSEFLDNNSYYNLLSHLEYVKTSESSFAKYTFACEFARLKRLGCWSNESDYSSILSTMKPKIADPRETAAYPNFEAYGQTQFEQYLSSGPMPDNSWLALQLRIFNLFEIVNGRSANIALEETLKSIEESGKNATGLTRQERDVSSMISDLLGLICSVAESKSKNQPPSLDSLNIYEKVEVPWLAQAGQSVDALPHMSFKLLAEFEIPHWQYLHTAYTLMDLCQLVPSAMEHIASMNRSTKKVDQKLLEEKVAHLRKMIPEIVSKLHQAAVKLQSQLSESGLEKKLALTCLGSSDNTEDVIGVNLRELIDSSWAEQVSMKLLGSWKEALDGVTRLRIPHGEMTIR